MPDRKPPRIDGDETRTVRALLQYQRDSLVRKVTGIDDEQARRTLVASGTTLLWLTKHLAYAETIWVVRRFAGEDVGVADDTVQPHDTISGAVAGYQATWQRVDAIISAAAGLDEPCRRVDADPPVNLRWVLLHLLEETARHAGHADILRELLDGSTGR